jgi:hypothetical protein
MRYNIKVKLCLLKKVPAVTITVFIGYVIRGGALTILISRNQTYDVKSPAKMSVEICKVNKLQLYNTTE